MSPFIELGVGFNPELTALDNVVVNAALLGMPRAEAIARFPAIIEFAELERFVDLKLKNYSSGMQVRLGFASMIQAEADIYLVDEVLAVGDARFQEKCFDTFRRLKKEGTDGRVRDPRPRQRRALLRPCVLLEQGEVVADGDPHDVIMDYRQRDLEAAQARHAAPAEGAQRWGDGAAEIVDAWFEDATGRRQDVFAQGERGHLSRRRALQRRDGQTRLRIVSQERERHAVFIDEHACATDSSTGVFEPRCDAGRLLRGLRRARFADGALLGLAGGRLRGRAARIADWREDMSTRARCRAQVTRAGTWTCRTESQRRAPPKPAAWLELLGQRGPRRAGTSTR